MATTTTNYAFDIPQSTDLVKDGATAIATLGQDIDTAMNTALGTNKAGMVLLNTTSLSGVSATSANAGTFNSTYDNYRLIIKITAVGTGTPTINLRLRASGSDNTTSNYAYQIVYGSYNNTAAGEGATGLNTWGLGGFATHLNSVIDLIAPNLTENTYGYGFYSTNNTTGLLNLNFRATTSFDSFTIYPASSTITGVYQVFGYNK